MLFACFELGINWIMKKLLSFASDFTGSKVFFWDSYMLLHISNHSFILRFLLNYVLILYKPYRWWVVHVCVCTHVCGCVYVCTYMCVLCCMYFLACLWTFVILWLTGFTLSFIFLQVMDCLPKTAPSVYVLGNMLKCQPILPLRHRGHTRKSCRERTREPQEAKDVARDSRETWHRASAWGSEGVAFSPSSCRPRYCSLWQRKLWRGRRED